MSTAAPRKAMLLAAGFGTRMRPLSTVRPKCLMPLWNVPIIERLLRMLDGWGVREVVVNLHHDAGAIVAALRGRAGSIRLTFSYEPEILGTGGALRRAGWFFDNEPFWLLNTDIAAEIAPEPFLSDWRQHRPLAVLWGTADRGPRTVRVRQGEVTDFRCPYAGGVDTMTFCGLQLVLPEIVSRIPEGFSTVVDAYESAMRDGQAVRMIDPPAAYWDDLGTPARYLAAHREIARQAADGLPGGGLYDTGVARTVRRLRRGGVSIRGTVAVPPDAAIAPTARLEDSVIWPGVTIPAGVDVRAAIVTATLPPGAWLSGVVTAAGDCDDASVRWALRQLDWPAADTCCAALPPRGSDRSFIRLLRGAERAMLIRYGTARRENRRQAEHARFLCGQGIPVPEPIAQHPGLRFALEGDAGDESLEMRVQAVGVEATMPIYRALMSVVARWHACPLDPLRGRLEPAFGPRLYAWEHDLFENWFLKGVLDYGPDACRTVRCELRTISQYLAGLPPVLVHRDLQSSNIMLDGEAIRIIDFQGMRRGPAAYDLASLLCDPYVMLPARYRAELLALYRQCRGAGDCPDADFHTAAVQRLAQALGAYGRLTRLAGLDRFAAYIGPACTMLGEVLDVMPPLPALRAVAGAGRISLSRSSS